MICRPKATAHVEQCVAQLPRDTLSIEFRHRSWWEGAERTASTLAWPREIGAVHTAVDEPQGADNSVPAVWEVTPAEHALLRLHGRNVETYNAPAATAADRFDYEHSSDELRGLSAEIVRLAYEAKNAYAIFNNCDEDKGIQNARTFMRMIGMQILWRNICRNPISLLGQLATSRDRTGV